MYSHIIAYYRHLESTAIMLADETPASEVAKFMAYYELAKFMQGGAERHIMLQYRGERQ